LKYFKTENLAEMFSVHKETIKREVARNNLKCFKVGSELRFTQEHVDEYTNVINNGKTTREIELEEEIEKLNKLIEQRDHFIQLIKNEVIKFPYE